VGTRPTETYEFWQRAGELGSYNRAVTDVMPCTTVDLDVNYVSTSNIKDMPSHPTLRQDQNCDVCYMH